MENPPKPPTTQRFLLSTENEVLEATSEEGGERFVEEISYLEQFVPAIGRILKMRAIQLGVVEDSDDQMAFRFSKDEEEIEGMVNGVPWALGDIISGKAWEVRGGKKS